MNTLELDRKLAFRLFKDLLGSNQSICNPIIFKIKFMCAHNNSVSFIIDNFKLWFAQNKLLSQEISNFSKRNEKQKWCMTLPSFTK